ncbi:MAG: hypothetical protein NTX15_11895 [Candidatus Kapabacteria bacterium]|nr:hypothetical protein [Candidatus Kapabacteria bacterium]
MKKQNVWAALAVATFTALALGLTACSDSGVTPEDPMGLTQRQTTSFDLNATPTEINDATMDMMMSERPDPNKGKPVRNPFAELLKHLNLTADQQAAVEGLLASHRECVSAALESLRAAEKEIISAARTAAEAVKQQVKDGTLTRDEARAQLRAISERTRQALKALPGREEARKAMKSCDDAFLRGLSEILTPEQTAILKRWVESRKGGKDNPQNPGGGGRDTTHKGGDTTGHGGGNTPPGGRG